MPNGPRAGPARGPLAWATPCVGPYPVTGKSKAKEPRAGPARGPFGIFAIFPKHEIFCDAGFMCNMLFLNFTA